MTSSPLRRCHDTWHDEGMAKRGEKRPWKMTYTWPAHEVGGKPITGTQSFVTEAQARDAAERQAAVIAPDGETRCTVKVTYRA